MEEVEEKLFSVEEKWIKNEISRDAYDKWYSTYNHSIINLKGAIERLSKDQSKVLDILKEKGYLIYEKRRDNLTIIPFSGEGGIRTPGPVTVNGFQDRRIRPLCHLSAANVHVECIQSKRNPDIF